MFAEIASLDAINHGTHVMMCDENWKYIWNRFDIDEPVRFECSPGRDEQFRR